MAARVMAAEMTSPGDPRLKGKERLMGLLLPKGLAAAVLACLPLQYGFSEAEVFPPPVLSLILLTNLLSLAAVRGGRGRS